LNISKNEMLFGVLHHEKAVIIIITVLKTVVYYGDKFKHITKLIFRCSAPVVLLS